MEDIGERIARIGNQLGRVCPKSVVECICEALGLCRTFIISHLQSVEAHGIIANDNFAIQVSVHDIEVECLCADIHNCTLSRIHGHDRYLYEDEPRAIGIIDLSLDGRRWEGGVITVNDVLVPYGYGTLYDWDGGIVYMGFMCGEEKVCFGTEYHENTIGNPLPLFQGYYYKNLKHGYGTHFDRNQTETTALYLDGNLPSSVSPSAIYNSMKSFVLWKQLNSITAVVLSNWLLTCLHRVFISPDSLPSIQFLHITDLPLLRHVTMASCKQVNVERRYNYRLLIENCCNLQEVMIGDYSLHLFGFCAIKNNSHLQSVSFGNHSFENGMEMKLESESCHSCFILDLPELQDLYFGDHVCKECISLIMNGRMKNGM